MAPNERSYEFLSNFIVTIRVCRSITKIHPTENLFDIGLAIESH